MTIGKRFSTALLLFCAWEFSFAQNVHLSGRCSDNTGNMKFSIGAMEIPDSDKRTDLIPDGDSFSAELPRSADGFYMLSGVTAERQILLPLYIPGYMEDYRFDFSVNDGFLEVPQRDDNGALSAFSAFCYHKGRYLWNHAGKMPPKEITAYLNRYITVADSLAEHYGCTDAVAEYLRLWAYNSIDDSRNNVPDEKKSLIPDLMDFTGNPEETLDNPIMVHFPMLSRVIVANLTDGNLTEKISALHEQYQCQEVCRLVTDLLIGEYVRLFDFSADYDKGVEELTSLVENFGIDKRYLDEFKLKKASAKGSPFPENVLLIDAEGNTVDFSSFKGSYVYVDLWASWCGPCIREIPYLKELEKGLGNKQVKFVSISVDTRQESWEKKMKELDLHGYQLFDSGNGLSKALNISGIPRFLIYDKEGKLYMKDAPRPSKGLQLKELLEGLK